MRGVSRICVRGGYALLAVLWISAAAAGISLTATAAARQAIATSRNRIALTEAEWLAEGCMARVQSKVLQEFEREANWSRGSVARAWLNLDSLLMLTSGTPDGGCTVSVQADGSRIDVNRADEQMLTRVFRHLGMQDTQADSLAQAICDWRDADTVPRALGAEREWYAARRMKLPFNRPFADMRELANVKGVLPGAFALDEYLGVNHGAVSINHAPGAVLAALPGFSDEAVIRALELQQRGRVIRTFSDIADGLIPRLRDSLNAAIPQLANLVAIEPQAWAVVARARSGNPVMSVSVEVRIERVRRTIRVARHRVWVQ
jgi:general secretion pathway protein K